MHIAVSTAFVATLIANTTPLRPNEAVPPAAAQQKHVDNIESDPNPESSAEVPSISQSTPEAQPLIPTTQTLSSKSSSLPSQNQPSPSETASHPMKETPHSPGFTESTSNPLSQVETTSPPHALNTSKSKSNQISPQMHAHSSTADARIDPRLLDRHRQRRLALQREPVFNGIGLLIGAGTSAAVVLGSGIALISLSRETLEVCDDFLGEPDCYDEPKHLEWQTFSSTMFTLGTFAATSIGISGGVLLGRYDAWRVHNKRRKRVNARMHLAIGSSLLGLSATLLAASMTSAFSNDDDVYEIGVPLFGTLGVLSATSGFTMVSYGASYLVRANRLKHLSVSPLLHRQTRSAGISIAGRF